MPFAISNSNVFGGPENNGLKYKYQDSVVISQDVSTENAKRVIDDLSAWVSKNGKTLDSGVKPGTLMMVKKGNNYELRRRQWYQLWNFVENRDVKRAEAYVKSLLQAAQLPCETSSASLTNSVTRKTGLTTADYKNIIIKPPSTSTNENSQSSALESPVLQNEKANAPSSAVKTLPEEESAIPSTYNVTKKLLMELGETKFEVDESHVKNFLATHCGIRLGKELSTETLAKVYDATLPDRKGNYCFQIEPEVELQPISSAYTERYNDKDEFIGNRLDLAQITSPSLTSMTKQIFVLVALQKTPQWTSEQNQNRKSFREGTSECKAYERRQYNPEYHYLPAAKAEDFINSIKSKDSTAEIGIVGQLMKFVP